MRHAAMPLPSQPSEIDVQLQAADAFATQGQLALALGMYRTAANLAEQRQDLVGALSIYARLARLDRDPAVRGRIGDLQVALGQRDVGAATLDGVARDELALGRLPNALFAAEQAARAVPTAARHHLAADIAARLGQADRCVDHLHALALVELAAGEVRRVQSICRRALTLRPSHVPMLRVAVTAHLRARDLHRAVACIRAILTQHPQDTAACEMMAEAFVVLGKRQTAAEVVRLLATRARAGAVAGDALAWVRRGLAWDPANQGLLALDRELTMGPANAPVQRAPVAEATRVIDLADLLEVGGAPPLRRGPPARPIRTASYANAR
jgi:tetratricopeptide (TPR) repeat protein